MTNAEKFKEVFGTDIYPKNNPKEAPCIFDIRNCIPGNTCEGCPYEDFWVKEYKEVNHMTNGEKLREIFDGMEYYINTHHTCGRCKYEQLPEDVYPCDRCMYGPDDRYDFWEEKEDE